MPGASACLRRAYLHATDAARKALTLRRDAVTGTTGISVRSDEPLCISCSAPFHMRFEATLRSAA